ncbi:hypothetical protein ABB37_01134 [Leptomonas pyrrhocoris]|uniref:Uncharacterized protein n=1 Tax=Leptomonas pyrrhocoris TaxID=157538 RepID=A0A0N0DYV9_LEPPY|nr:hypothetical protein ABB37_01134 [Leptomonas pyrrhocoris]XP_015663047.1 hypothetical protein ABB37_01134 [Leptomonas pyrrhocoris]KPA84607.1 hypothetical protein ABB37_01134 [Leptomonas pyrrhocoris]KPA84608.1 hypothetical protein ABB37_01134 [Leptomonas pyrrhocoris]|eukprot:XP_015663046.1 hypothetical protein ABB37_01134 [Leptomonas pyrrhocoris]
MPVFDGVDLPFADEAPSSASSSSVRQLALAREVVLAELKNNAEAASIWEEASAKSLLEQERNAALYRSFIAELRQRCSLEGLSSFSPISGSVRPSRAVSSTGPLDLVTVAAPPVALQKRVGEGEEATSNGGLHDVGVNLMAEEETPLLQSSAHVSQVSSVGDSATWTPQQAASQSSLDGVFFEALLSQQLNLSLSMSCADPSETLEEMLRNVHRVEKTVREETSLLEYVNAARFAEQRAYKRRRTELESQVTKSHAKVASLEKLLNVGASDVFPKAPNAAERLRLRLLE